MKARPYTLLLHPALLISLALLLLNDFYLKQAFHNWLTGKLSDFAGLLVFTVFLFVIFPAYKKTVIVCCILFFCWWKSSLSNYFIFFLQNDLSLPIQRIVDYSDLFALSVLPVACRLKPAIYPLSFVRSLAVYAIGSLCLFSFCYTSFARHVTYYSYRESEIAFQETFNTWLTEDEVLEKLDPGKKSYKKNSVRFYRVTAYEDFYYRVKPAADSPTLWLPVKNTMDSALFVKRTEPSFFTIPKYVLGKDTLRDVELRIYPSGIRRKPTSIQIESFVVDNPSAYTDFYNSRKRKQYMKHFRLLFR